MVSHRTQSYKPRYISVPASSHGASDKHRLTNQLVVNRDERVVGRKGPCGSFPVHQEGVLFAADHVRRKESRKYELMMSEWWD